MNKILCCYYVSYPRFFSAVTSALSFDYYNNEENEIEYIFHIDYEDHINLKNQDENVIIKLFSKRASIVSISEQSYNDIGFNNAKDKLFFKNTALHPITLLKPTCLKYFKQNKYDYILYSDDDILCQNRISSLLKNNFIIATRAKSEKESTSIKHIILKYLQKNFKINSISPITTGWILYSQKISSDKYLKEYSNILKFFTTLTKQNKLFISGFINKSDVWNDEVLHTATNSVLNIDIFSNGQTRTSVPMNVDNSNIFIHSTRPGRFKFWGSNLTQRLCPDWCLFYKKYIYSGGRKNNGEFTEFEHLKNGDQFYKTLILPYFWNMFISNNQILFNFIHIKQGFMTSVLNCIIPNNLGICDFTLIDIYRFEVSLIKVNISFNRLKINNIKELQNICDRFNFKIQQDINNINIEFKVDQNQITNIANEFILKIIFLTFQHK